MKSVPLCAVIGLLLLAVDRDVNGIFACFDVSDNFASGRTHEHYETTCGVVYAHSSLESRLHGTDNGGTETQRKSVYTSTWYLYLTTMSSSYLTPEAIGCSSHTVQSSYAIS